jgi:hypothetical protein
MAFKMNIIIPKDPTQMNLLINSVINTSNNLDLMKILHMIVLVIKFPIHLLMIHLFLMECLLCNMFLKVELRFSFIMEIMILLLILWVLLTLLIN